jgi:hypothetical protein
MTVFSIQDEDEADEEMYLGLFDGILPYKLCEEYSGGFESPNNVYDYCARMHNHNHPKLAGPCVSLKWLLTDMRLSLPFQESDKTVEEMAKLYWKMF